MAELISTEVLALASLTKLKWLRRSLPQRGIGIILLGNALPGISSSTLPLSDWMSSPVQERTNTGSDSVLCLGSWWIHTDQLH